MTTGWASFADVVNDKDVDELIAAGFDFDQADPASSQHGPPPAHDGRGAAAQGRLAPAYAEPDASSSSDPHSDEELKPLPPPPPRSVSLPVPVPVDANSWYNEKVVEATRHHAPLLEKDPNVRDAAPADLIRALFTCLHNGVKNTLQPPPAPRKKRPAPVAAPAPAPAPMEPPAKKPKKTHKPAAASAPRAPKPLSDESVALEWQGVFVPPAVPYTGGRRPMHLLLTHTFTSVLLWSLRGANQDSQLIKTMLDHDVQLLDSVRAGVMVKRLQENGGQSRVLTPEETKDPSAQLIAAGLGTAYSFFQLFAWVGDLPALELTPIWSAEACHGQNDEIALLKDEYRMWVKPPGSHWTMEDTVAKARVAVKNYKIVQAMQVREPARPAPSIAKSALKNDPFGGDDDDDAGETAMDQVEDPAAAPDVSEVADLPVPAMERVLMPTADEFSAPRFCDVTMKKMQKRSVDWILEHADTLFSVRERPSKESVIVLLHSWHRHLVETIGRSKEQTPSVIAVFHHHFSHFLLGLTLLADAARPKPSPPRPYYAFDLCTMNIYEH